MNAIRRRPRFLRKDWHKISGLGLRRKSKQKWRKPKGRHNKLREKKKSHGAWPSIGYRSPREIRATIQGMNQVIVHNLDELQKVSKDAAIIIAHVGSKKKAEIANKAMQLGIKILNLNAKKFLKKIAVASKKLEQGNEGKIKNET